MRTREIELWLIESSFDVFYYCARGRFCFDGCLSYGFSNYEQLVLFIIGNEKAWKLLVLPPTAELDFREC